MAGEDFGPENGEAGGEVVTLFVELGEAVAVALVMFGGGVLAAGLFFGVEDFEGEDGEAVDHEAGGFGVERRGVRLCRRGFEEGDVDALDEVVAELVEGVDGVLDVDHGAAGGQRGTGLVFAVPEIEVGAVLVQDEGFERGAGGKEGLGGVVPVACGLVVELGDDGGVQHEGLGVMILGVSMAGKAGSRVERCRQNSGCRLGSGFFDCALRAALRVTEDRGYQTARG